MKFFQMYKEKKQNQKTKKETERFVKKIKDIIIKTDQHVQNGNYEFVQASFEHGEREYRVYAEHSKNKWTETTFEMKVRSNNDYISIGKYDGRKDIAITWNEKFTSKTKNYQFILDNFEKIMKKQKKSKTTAKSY